MYILQKKDLFCFFGSVGRAHIYCSRMLTLILKIKAGKRQLQNYRKLFILIVFCFRLRNLTMALQILKQQCTSSWKHDFFYFYEWLGRAHIYCSRMLTLILTIKAGKRQLHNYRKLFNLIVFCFRLRNLTIALQILKQRCTSSRKNDFFLLWVGGEGSYLLLKNVNINNKICKNTAAAL